ncbi:MAG: hypothetical protein AB1478_04720 [Nitrospirota bacterium]
MQIRVPLFTQLRDLAKSIKSKSTYGLKIDTPELLLFKRLFTFSIHTEKYIQTLMSGSLSDLKQIAKEIVWPALTLDINEIDRLLSKPIETKELSLHNLRTGIDKCLIVFKVKILYNFPSILKALLLP